MTNQQSRLLQLVFMSFMVLLALLLLWPPAQQAFAPDLGTVNLAQVEASKLPKSHYYAQVSGYANGPSVDLKLRKQGMWRYIPLRSTSTSKSPVALVVACRVSAIEQCLTQDPQTQLLTAEGYVMPDDRPDVRGQLAQQGVTLAKTVKYLTPEHDRGKAQTMLMVVGGIFVMVAGGFFQVLGDR